MASAAEAYPGANLTQAQTGVNLPSTNPDIQGYAIRLSSFVAHLCVALLIAYSTKTQQRFYLPLLSQLGLIIFAIWLCRGRNQLSLSDVEFAIIQTRSPVSIYTLLLVIPRLFFQTPHFKKKDAASKSNNTKSFFRGVLNSGSINWALTWRRLLGLLYALCCLSVNLVRQFDKAGYTVFTQDARGPFPDLIAPTSPIRLEGPPDGKVWIGLAICSAFIYECVLHRHGEERREIMHQLAGKRKKSLKAWPLSKRLRWGFVATWFIITKLHPWLPSFYALVMFLKWSNDMNIWEIEDNFQWTFGQFLAIFQVIIIIAPCWQLCRSRWQEIALIPCRLILDVIWLISGNGQPWSNPTESNLILRNLWDAFPLDVTPEEIGLPTSTPAHPLTVTNSFPADQPNARVRSRHGQNRTNRGPRWEQDRFIGPLEEEDIADQISSQNRVHLLHPL